jgi:hypothetical protein
MNVIHFGEGGCEKIRRYLDSYLDGELLIETNHEVLRHLEGCQACTREIDARGTLKKRVHQAGTQLMAPPYLAPKIREALRGQEPARSTWNLRLWLVPSAALVLIALGTFAGLRQRTVSSQHLASIMAIGVADHVHCAVPRNYALTPPSLTQMESDMGPYKDMIPVVRGLVPAEYRLEQAHQCTAGGRKFTHMIFHNAAALISVVVARKGVGESFEGYGIKPALTAAGVPLYQQRAGKFAVVGAETPDRDIFIISNLRDDENTRLAASVAPQVSDFLTKSSYATAQPPLPLQEFFPAQPLSPLLHPPLPLHVFKPLQSCFSAFVFFGVGFLSSAAAIAAPADKPATTALSAVPNLLRFIGSPQP